MIIQDLCAYLQFYVVVTGVHCLGARTQREGGEEEKEEEEIHRGFGTRK